MTTDAEHAVIGSLVLDASPLDDLDLTAADFTERTCREVYRAVEALRGESQPIDVLTVAKWLEARTGSKWLATVGEIARQSYVTANIGAYAALVREASQKRRAREVAAKLAARIEADGEQAIDSAIRDLMLLSTTRRTHEHSLAEGLRLVVDHLDDESEERAAIKSGLHELDTCLGGFHRSDLITVGARPAMGKTAFMVNLALAAGVPLGIISSEQPLVQLASRAIAIRGRVNAHRMRLKKLADADYPRVNDAIQALGEARIWVNDRSRPHIDDVIRQARSWAYAYGIRCLFVDYIQRIAAGRREKRNEEIADVARGLKDLARDLDIPVIALAQVGREVERRQNQRPLMSDFKDSGVIEDESDVILTLYRDEVVNPDGAGKGVLEVNVMKNRHGPTGHIRCAWLGEFMAVENLAHQYGMGGYAA